MKDFTIYTLCGIIEKGVAFLFLCLLSNQLEKDELGYLGLFLSIGAFLQIFIGMGGDTYARLRVVKNPQKFKATLSSIIKIFLLSSAITYILYKIFFEHNSIFILSEKHLNFVFIYSIFNYITLVYLSINQGLRNLRKYFFIVLAKASLELGLFLVLLKHYDSLIDGRINTLLLSLSIIGSICIIIMFREYKFNLKDKSETKNTSKFLLRSLPNTLVVGSVFTIDRIIIAENSLSLVGEIVFLFGICSPLLFLVESINKTILPKSFHLLKENNATEYNIYNTRAIIMYLAVGLFYCLFLQIFSILFINANYQYIVKYSFLFLFLPFFKLCYYSFARVFTYKELVQKLFYINFPLSLIYLTYIHYNEDLNLNQFLLCVLVYQFSVFYATYYYSKKYFSIVFLSLSNINKAIEYNFFAFKYYFKKLIKF